MNTTVATFNNVSIDEHANIHTPQGSARLVDAEITYRGTHTITESKSAWSTPMVLIALGFAFFSFGTSLILLFLSRSERTFTRIVDVVEIRTPNLQHYVRGDGGMSFVGYANSWKSSLKQWELEQRDAYNLEVLSQRALAA